MVRNLLCCFFFFLPIYIIYIYSKIEGKNHGGQLRISISNMFIQNRFRVPTALRECFNIIIEDEFLMYRSTSTIPYSLFVSLIIINLFSIADASYKWALKVYIRIHVGIYLHTNTYMGDGGLINNSQRRITKEKNGIKDCWNRRATNKIKKNKKKKRKEKK